MQITFLHKLIHIKVFDISSHHNSCLAHSIITNVTGIVHHFQR